MGCRFHCRQAKSKEIKQEDTNILSQMQEKLLSTRAELWRRTNHCVNITVFRSLLCLFSSATRTSPLKFEIRNAKALLTTHSSQEETHAGGQAFAVSNPLNLPQIGTGSAASHAPINESRPIGQDLRDEPLVLAGYLLPDGSPSTSEKHLYGRRSSGSGSA